MNERIKELREQAWALVPNEERDRGELYEASEQWERCDQKFAELVRADEREKYKWDIHSCGPTCQRYACVAMREAVAKEREACAKVCDHIVEGKDPDDIHSDSQWMALTLAAEIRARSNT